MARIIRFPIRYLPQPEVIWDGTGKPPVPCTWTPPSPYFSNKSKSPRPAADPSEADPQQK
jgi:hypothetical protein